MSSPQNPAATAANLDEANTALERQVDERTRALTDALGRQTALNEALKLVIGRSASVLDAVLEGLIENAVRLCAANCGVIYTLEGDVLRPTAFHGLDNECREQWSGVALDVSRGSAAGRCVIERRAVEIADVFADPEYVLSEASRKLGWRSLLAVPLFRDEDLLGVITVHRAEAGSFGNAKNLVTVVADQVVIAIENARMVAKTREAPRFAEAAVRELKGIMDNASIGIAFTRDRKFFRYNPSFARMFGFQGDTGIGQPGRAIYVSDEDYAEVGRLAGQTLAKNLPLEHDLFLRRQDGSSFWGNLKAFVLDPNDPTAGTVWLTEDRSNVKAAEEELRTALQQQTALSESLKAISNSPADVQPVLDTIVRNAVVLCEALFGAVFRFDGELMHMVAHHNMTPEVLGLLNQLYPMRPSREQATGRVILDGDLVHVHDALADPEYRQEVAIRGGWRSILAVPMSRDGAAIGVIWVARAVAGPFPNNEIVLLNSFADQAVIAVEKVRMYRELEAQTEQVRDWNKKLEDRVQEQVANLDRLGRLKGFFSPQIAELIISGGGEDLMKTHRREVVVVFTDLRGFTAFTDSSEPEEVMGVLGEYHHVMGPLIISSEGTLAHFAGDGLMVLFNDPIKLEDPLGNAVKMALRMQELFVPLRASWKKRGYPLDLGIGIAQGYATLGTIGFEGRWEYTCIGSVANLASRLCGEAKGGQVLINQKTLSRIEDRVEAEPLGEMALKGITHPVQTFKITALKG